MKVFFKFSLLLLTIFASAKLCAQKPQGRHGQALIDSLVTELQKQKEDTAKVSLLSDISAGYKDLNADNGIKYGELAMVLATKLEWVKGQALSHIDIGVNIQNKSDYLKALDHYQQALKLYENINDKRGITDAMQNIGSVYSDLCDYPKALEYDLAALKGFDDIGYKDGIAMVKNNIGSVYILQGDYPKALEYYFSALKIHEASGNKNRIAGITGNIGNVYFSQKDYPKALEYYFKTLQMDEETGDKEGVARNIGNVALTYASQGNYAAAITNYHKALQLAEQTGYQHSIAWNLEALGETYIDLVTDTAARPAAKEIPGEESIPTNKATLVHLAIDNLQRSLAMGKELHIMDVVQSCYEYLSIAYKISGDYKLALEYSDKYRTIKDSVFSKENDENIVRMGVKNEYDKKAAEAKKEAALKLQRQQSYTYVGIGGVVLLLIFTFFITRNNKLLAKEKQRSEHLLKRSDDLLLNILPEEVANELKEKGSAAAKYYDDVTVLFTDFVNFTGASERMAPQALIDELHTCFKAFDEITAKHNIEKIKTIGDAYLAVAGLPVADPRHAENVVKAAIEINEFMAKRLAQPGSNTFQIRIGIHSGNVVAGIVGVKKFAYDIWGDTVNTAARMEQNSEAGKINISETTYKLVRDQFDCTFRGEIAAKNKGQLKMYFINQPVTC